MVPDNAAALAGDELTLRCDTNTSTRLSWYVGSARQLSKIFNGFNVSPEFPRYAIRSTSSYDLVIGDVQSSDAGLYWCVHSRSHSATALLIVLGKNHRQLAYRAHSMGPQRSPLSRVVVVVV